MSLDKNLYWFFAAEDEPIQPLDLIYDSQFLKENIIDAILPDYGNILCRVLSQDGRSGRILWTMDCSHILDKFARKCALEVVHLWPVKCPPIVRQYLETGDESIREEAEKVIENINDKFEENGPILSAYSVILHLPHWDTINGVCRDLYEDLYNDPNKSYEIYTNYGKELEKLILAEYEKRCEA